MRCTGLVVSCLFTALVPPAPAQTPLTAVQVATGLQNPVLVTAPRGDADRAFLVEQFTGRIRILRGGALVTPPFLDIGAKVDTSGSETGLLGLAFHPSYATNGYFYVNYTRVSDGATIVERYRVSSTDPDRADPASAAIGLGPIAQPFDNHNGGCLAFGPDGYLYIGMGDGGSGGDPFCHGQTPGTLLAKMLRVDVDRGVPFVAPPSNPFVGNSAYRPEIWAMGLRNPWRFSFDRDTGDLYIGDVGQGAREEVDFEAAGGPGGRNYGWSVMEGTTCYFPNCPVGTPPCHAPVYQAPLYEYQTGGDCSIVGGYVYRGCALPDLRGTYWFADYCSNRVWSFRYVAGQGVRDLRERTGELFVPNQLSAISSMGEDGLGELYVVDYWLGSVYKIAARAGGPSVDLGYGTRGSNGQIPDLRVCGRLEPGLAADFVLRRAPASTPAVFLIALQANPTPWFGGTIVPLPAIASLGVSTDTRGELQFSVAGGGGPLTLYCQYVLLDVGLPLQIGFSNAISVRVP